MCRGQIEDLVPDGHARSETLTAAGTPEHAKRQVLDRKVTGGTVRGIDPTTQPRVVGRVHGRVGSKRFGRSRQIRP